MGKLVRSLSFLVLLASAASAATSAAPLPPPSNDSCATPLAIAGTGQFQFTTIGATTGAEGQAHPTCTGGSVSAVYWDTWFEWTAPATGLARIETLGLTNLDTTLVAYAGSGCPAGAALACNRDVWPSVQSRIHFPCVAGVAYTLQIGLQYTGFVTPTTGLFDVDVLTTPPNDDCSAPQAISGFGATHFDLTVATAGAQSQTAQSCWPPISLPTERDVWFAWTAPQTGLALIETCDTFPGGAPLDTRIAVYSGSGCALPGTLLGCNDDYCSVLSRVVFPATAGQTYTIQLGDRRLQAILDGEGSFRIRDGQPPAHDNCATPQPIFGSGVFAFDSTDATTSAQGQNELACNFQGVTGMAFDLWYEWRATATGLVEFSTCGGSAFGSNQNTKLAVYLGGGCPSGPALACNDNDGVCGTYGLESRLTWSAVCGQLYTLQVARGIGVSTPTFGSFFVSESGTPCASGVATFCFGDGSLGDHTTPCPCGNNGSAGNGCAHSFDSGGAHLDATGATALDDLVLVSTSTPASSFTLFLQHDVLADHVFHDGVSCSGGALVRLRGRSASAGQAWFPNSAFAADATLTLSQRGGVAPFSGAQRFYSAWYRNASTTFCPPATANVTNGLSVIW